MKTSGNYYEWRARLRGATAMDGNGYRHPDGVECEARTPEACPFRRKELREAAKTDTLDPNEGTVVTASKVDSRTFHDTIVAAKESQDARKQWRVDAKSVEEYDDCECYATENGSTFALHGKDIVSVCRNRNDKDCYPLDLMAQAVEAGGDRLDSYEGNHAFYRKCGFEPVSWTKFNAEYAPDGASPEDIVFYRYTGNVQCLNPQDAKADLEKFKSGMEPMEYDDACAYRDNEIEKISGK